MKHWMMIGLGAILMLGCSGAEDGTLAPEERTAASTDALQTGLPWIGPVSEESNKNSAVCPYSDRLATRAQCAGSYCDDSYLYCGTPPRGFTRTGVDWGWTAYISEESISPAMCPGTSAIDGIRATGSYADNVSIHCTGITFPPAGTTNCAWTPWLSEENGGIQTFKANIFSAFSAVALAVKCRGSYCDDKAYWVCEPKCQSDADCGSGFYCHQSSGGCTIG